MSFRNKTVVITGASSGIGRRLALAYAREGARVGITARRVELLETLSQEIRQAGGTVAAVPADVTNREGLISAIQQLANELGPVDLLIANAGVGYTTGADPMNVPGVEQTMKVNFLGVVYAFEAVLPEMLKRKSGQLVAISSMAAYKGLPGAAAYCASKSAVSAYLESLRIELYGSGVYITTVCPGFIETPMTARNPRPMPFLMSPEEAAHTIMRAIRLRKGVYNFPWVMRILMELTRWAPDRFIKKRVPVTAANPNAPQ